MRITNNMMINNMNRNLNRNLMNMDQRQNQIATGKRIHRPSDDPIGTTRIMQLKSHTRQLDQNHSAAEDALSWMNTTESVANQYVDALQRSRELTVQAANGSLTQSETKKIQQEISEIKEHIIGLGNTSHGGKHIFSGKEIDKPLLNDDGSYNDAVHQKLLEDSGLIDDQIKYAIGMNETIPINLTGLEMFEDQGALTEWSETMSLPEELGEGNASTVELMGMTLNIEVTEANFIDGEGNTLQDDAGNEIRYKGGSFVDEDGEDFTPIVNDEEISDTSDLSEDAEQTPVSFTSTLGYRSLDEDGEEQYTVFDIPDLDLEDLSKGETFGAMEDIQGIIQLVTNPAPSEMSEEDAEEHNDRLQDMNQAFIQQQMLKANPGAEEDINPENIENFLNGNENSFLYEGKRIYRLENFNFETTGVSSDNLQENKETGYQKKIAFSASPKKPGVMQMLDRVEKNLLEGNQEALSEDLDDFDRFLDVALTARSTLGARVNRGTLVRDRIETDTINFREQLSNVEDVDMAETITKLMNEENVYRASLSVGARIVQPTLIDFLR